VQDLEQACRQLEEAAEESRQESMERSVMDEASGEALRMLHKQIANLEREKADWSRKEQGLQEEVEALDALARERSEDVMNLKERLWTRDESDRELKEDTREANEHIEMTGNVSVGVFDEEELKRLLAEKDQKNEEDTQRFRTVVFELRQELEETKTKHGGFEMQKARLEGELQEINQQLLTRNDEYATLKTELEAQWSHTETAGSKIQTLEKELVELTQERDTLRVELDELEARTANMELEWNELEDKRNELEAELQEVWNLKDSLEKDRGEVGFFPSITDMLDRHIIITSSRIPCIKNESKQNSWLLMFRNVTTGSPNSNKSNSSRTIVLLVWNRNYVSRMKRSRNTPAAPLNENQKSSSSAKR
jgi:predicted  nucleic acid-binding Zn-ribbon protein